MLAIAPPLGILMVLAGAPPSPTASAGTFWDGAVGTASPCEQHLLHLVLLTHCVLFPRAPVARQLVTGEFSREKLSLEIWPAPCLLKATATWLRPVVMALGPTRPVAMVYLDHVLPPSAETASLREVNKGVGANAEEYET